MGTDWKSAMRTIRPLSSLHPKQSLRFPPCEPRHQLHEQFPVYRSRLRWGSSSHRVESGHDREIWVELGDGSLPEL
jgi:hypothetical protein